MGKQKFLRRFFHMVTKFDPLYDFSVRLSSDQLKAQECKNLPLLNKNMFNGTLEIRFLLILVGCLKT